MTCSRYGCDLTVAPNALGNGQACPVHGLVLPILHDNLIDRRWAQAWLEINQLAHQGENCK